jgi:hypothetical protein
MAARDYSFPQRPVPAHTDPQGPATTNCISMRRRIRIQAETDLYFHLDPEHKRPPCSAVYELEDRTKPSISSF